MNEAANEAQIPQDLTAAQVDKIMGTVPPDHIMQFFACDHLPQPLQTISRPFGTIAREIVNTLPRNPERTVALRKLLEAKDAAVRAFIAK